MDILLVLMLALSALAWQQATCQFDKPPSQPLSPWPMAHMQIEVHQLIFSPLSSANAIKPVESRAPTDKLSPASGSSKATVYQRHLSPHRMMHFGKRPIYQSAPILLAPAPSYQNSAGGLSGDNLFVGGLQFLPDLVSLTLERGQELQQPLMSDEAGSLTVDAANVDAFGVDASSDPLSRMRYIVESLPQAPPTTDYLYPAELTLNSHLRPRATSPSSLTRQQYQPQLFNAKLMSSDDRDSTEKRSMTSGSGTMARSSIGFLTKYTNALPYIKKADTKDNFFMHFGRK